MSQHQVVTVYITDSLDVEPHASKKIWVVGHGTAANKHGAGTHFGELHKEVARLYGVTVESTALMDDHGSTYPNGVEVVKDRLEFPDRRVLLCPVVDYQEPVVETDVPVFEDGQGEEEGGELTRRPWNIFKLIVHLLSLMLLILTKNVAEGGTASRHNLFRAIHNTFARDLRSINTGQDICEWLEGPFADGLFRGERDASGAIMSYNMLQDGLDVRMKTSSERFSSHCDANHTQGSTGADAECMPAGARPGQSFADSSMTESTVYIEPQHYTSGWMVNQSVLMEDSWKTVWASLCSGAHQSQFSPSSAAAPLLVNSLEVLDELRVRFLIYNHAINFYALVFPAPYPLPVTLLCSSALIPSTLALTLAVTCPIPKVAFTFVSDPGGRYQVDFDFHSFKFSRSPNVRGSWAIEWRAFLIDISNWFFALQLLVVLIRTWDEVSVARASPTAYFTSLFHVLEMATLVFLYSQMALRVAFILYSEGHQLLPQLATLSKPHDFVLDHDVLHTAAIMYEAIDWLSAYAILTTSVSLFGYFSLMPKRSVVYLTGSTLEKGAAHLIPYTVIIIYMLIGLAVVAEQAFGTTISEFSDLFTSFATLCRMAAGYGGVYFSLTRSTPIPSAGVLFFFLCQLFIIFLNPLFFSIICHSYATRSVEHAERMQKYRERKARLMDTNTTSRKPKMIAHKKIMSKERYAALAKGVARK